MATIPAANITRTTRIHLDNTIRTVDYATPLDMFGGTMRVQFTDGTVRYYDLDEPVTIEPRIML